jgi:hypothetical protein
MIQKPLLWVEVGKSACVMMVVVDGGVGTRSVLSLLDSS